MSPTPEATILAVNDAFLKASSRRREDLVGVSLFEAFPANKDDPHDTGEATLRASLARVVETGKPDPLPAQRYPIRVVAPDGSVTYEERFWGAISTPIFAEDGQITCILHSTVDVTAEVRSAAALQDSEKRYRALTSATEDVIYRMNPDWTELHQMHGRLPAGRRPAAVLLAPRFHTGRGTGASESGRTGSHRKQDDVCA